MITNKSIEQLEGDYWGNPPNDESRLVKKCYLLRKKKIKNLDIEDLRLLISQNIGTNLILPLAVKLLKSNLLAEGDLYPGDLLSAVLNVEDNNWSAEPLMKKTFKDYLRKNETDIYTARISEEIKFDLRNMIAQFVGGGKDNK